MNIKSFLSENIYNPVTQVGLVVGVSLLTMLGMLVLNGTGMMSIESTSYWTMACSLVFFYAIINSLGSLTSSDLDKYWGRAILSFAVLALTLGAMAYLFSGLSISDLTTYKIIYFVLCFGYLVFLSILGFMKRIVDFAEREDWQAPKVKQAPPKKDKDRFM